MGISLRAETAWLAKPGAGTFTVGLRGDPGLGKTHFLTTLAATHPGRVVRVRAGEPLTDVPFGALAEAMDVDAFTDRAHALAALSARGRRLLLVDDLHWADQETVDLLANLRHHPRGRTLVVLAYRPRQSPTSPPVDREVTLTPMSIEEIGDHFDVPRAHAATLHALTDGIPGYITALSQQAHLRAELATLSPPASHLAWAAAVLAEPATETLLAQVSGVPPTALPELSTRDVLRETKAGWAFRHEVLRQVAYQAADRSFIREAHLRAAEALRGTSPDRLRRHLLWADPAPQPHKPPPPPTNTADLAAALTADTPGWPRVDPTRVPEYGERLIKACLAAGDHTDAHRWLRAMRASGVDTRPLEPPPSPDLSPLGLPPRQAEVCALVANGLTNREIEQRLGLSRRTVETHIASARTTLGITSRAALAAAVTRALTPPEHPHEHRTQPRTVYAM